MNCETARPFVSDLYDGQRIPVEAAGHINHCVVCRAALREYGEIGAEIRLLAYRDQPAQIPAVSVSGIADRSRQGSNWKNRITWPRLAAATAAILLVAVFAGRGWLIARTSKPWFHFQLEPQMENGYVRGWAAQSPGSPESDPRSNFVLQGVAVSVEVKEVQDNRVRLLGRAVNVGIGARGREIGEKLNAAQWKEYWYITGTELPITVEGGDPIMLTGEIRYERPKGNGPKLELSQNEMALMHPVLLRDSQLVVELTDRTNTTGQQPGLVIYAPGSGIFLIGLAQFPGAMQGQANGSRVEFTFGEEQFQLYSAGPITGGDQPRKIWVYHDPNYKLSEHGWSEKADHFGFAGSGGIPGLQQQFGLPAN